MSSISRGWVLLSASYFDTLIKFLILIDLCKIVDGFKNLKKRICVDGRQIGVKKVYPSV